MNGGGRESGAAYRPYSVRFAGQYFAPWNISIGASYVIQSGGYVGPVITRLAAADPTFGPATVRLADGSTQSNPLATTIRFCGAAALPCATNPTRADGQTLNDAARYLQLKVGRVFKMNGMTFEPAVNVFNVFNTGAYTQWDTGANRLYSSTYLAVFNRHPPRAMQLSFAAKF